MNYEELQERLKELDIRIPHGTLTRWASEGLVPGPSRYFKPRERKVGRPSTKRPRAKNRGSPGRFMNWPDGAVEQAAAVWAVRNKFKQISKEQLLLDGLGRRHVPTETVLWIKQEGTTLHNLLETDCKAASQLLRAILDNGMKVVGNKGIVEERRLYFNKDSLYPLIVLWITTIERARRGIPLSKVIHLSYSWLIQENGEASLTEVSISTIDFGIEFEVTHLAPMDNGFSMDFGFPQYDLLIERGFLDIFELRTSLWHEHFHAYPRRGGSEELNDDDDPDGLAAWYYELEYGDI